MWKHAPTTALAAGATMALAVIQLAVYTPIGAVERRLLGGTEPSGIQRTPTGTVALDASDDAREPAMPPTGGINAPVNQPAGSTEPTVRRPLPTHIDRVRVPSDAVAVSTALQVTLSGTDLQNATVLRRRVVPDAMFNAADAATRAAVETFIAAGPGGVTSSDPCVQIGAGQRAALIEAFRMTQRRLPTTTTDYQFACALVTDPANPVDVTKAFGSTHRNVSQETYALKNFVNFFGRLPSKEADGDSLAPDVADRDWWAVKFLSYHPVLAATIRNRDGELTCIRAFVDAEVDL
ncbi:MAG: hypothetical protein Q7S02_04355, partial [bacterium]|nr:hypothetical protein [bacterium]